jgi:hypothetical protein
MWGPDEVVPSLRLRNMDTVNDRVDLAAPELGVNTMREECVTCFIFEVHHSFFGVAGYLDALDIFGIDDLLDEGAIVGCDVFQTSNVYFVYHKQSGFASE